MFQAAAACEGKLHRTRHFCRELVNWRSMFDWEGLTVRISLTAERLGGSASEQWDVSWDGGYNLVLLRSSGIPPCFPEVPYLAIEVPLLGLESPTRHCCLDYIQPRAHRLTSVPYSRKVY